VVIRSGLDQRVGHPRRLCEMPPYATRRSRRCGRQHRRCGFACPLCPGVRAKGARIFPSHATVISIRSWDTRCLIFPCKIPANLPDHPRRRSLRWPREPCRKTPESSRHFAHRSAGVRPVISAWRSMAYGVSRDLSRGSPVVEARS
jgi:hypothetical protein